MNTQYEKTLDQIIDAYTQVKDRLESEGHNFCEKLLWNTVVKQHKKQVLKVFETNRYKS